MAIAANDEEVFEILEIERFQTKHSVVQDMYPVTSEFN